jgi:hypothetical protein
MESETKLTFHFTTWRIRTIFPFAMYTRSYLKSSKLSIKLFSKFTLISLKVHISSVAWRLTARRELIRVVGAAFLFIFLSSIALCLRIFNIYSELCMSGLINHAYEVLPSTGRVTDGPRAVLLDWMASPDGLVAAKTAQEIFDQVESYAAERGRTPAEATELRSNLSTKMITSVGKALSGRTVVCLFTLNPRPRLFTYSVATIL